SALLNGRRALLAAGTGRTGRGPSGGNSNSRDRLSAAARNGSDATLLRRSAAVVRDRGVILDRRHLQAVVLEGRARRLTAGTGPLHTHLDLLHAEPSRLVGAALGGARGREGRRLAGALEADAAGGVPAEGLAVDVGDGDHRVVERRVDVRDALDD